MHALIVAAGYGSRLRSVSRCKPLTPVAGMPLIDRVILSARAGGATGFTVVTGHKGALLERHLARAAAGWSFHVECVRTPDWSRPNGLSVLTGAARIGPERHLLLMADHLFDPVLVERVIAAPPAPLTLAIDRRIGRAEVDLDDVTRVRTAGARITAIGKHLEQYDAFDCGVFAVDGRFHAALGASLAAGGTGSISDGVTVLAQQGDATVVDVGDAWWHDVDDAPALAHAEAVLAARLAA